MKNVARALALVALAAFAVSAEEAPAKQESKMTCCKKQDGDKKMCAKDSGCCKDCCSKKTEEPKQ